MWSLCASVPLCVCVCVCVCNLAKNLSGEHPPKWLDINPDPHDSHQRVPNSYLVRERGRCGFTDELDLLFRQPLQTDQLINLEQCCRTSLTSDLILSCLCFQSIQRYTATFPRVLLLFRSLPLLTSIWADSAGPWPSSRGR